MEQPLPNELVECIIGNLYSDIPSLLSCALVGRAWVHSSQRAIFRDIILSLPPHVDVNNDFVMDLRHAYRDTTRKLAAAFDSTPHLATYVRFLGLVCFLEEDELHIATANVIRQLSSLKHLQFGEIHWDILSPTLKAALAGLFQTPSLTEFTFLDFLNASLTEMTSLLNQMPRQSKVLHLLSMYFEGPTEDTEQGESPPQSPPKSIQLEKLTISDCHGTFFMDWFLKDTCPFEIRNIQSLDISMWESRNTDTLLHYVGRNLRELELDISSACSDCLTYTPNLHTLHLHRIAMKSSSSPVPMICTIFEPLLNPNGNKCSLQYLKIDLIINHISRLVSHLDQWAKINELLNRLEFSVLERVDVNLLSRTRPDLSGAGDLLRGKLQILEASGKLYIHCF